MQEESEGVKEERVKMECKSEQGGDKIEISLSKKKSLQKEHKLINLRNLKETQVNIYSVDSIPETEDPFKLKGICEELNYSQF